MLKRYFVQQMIESQQYSAIGSWWERKKGKDANEIDIVGIEAEGKSAVVAEVKRQRRNYNHKAFMTKVEHLRESVLSKYEVKPRLLTLEDM